MRKFGNFTLKQYLIALSDKHPIPGGGSASAVVGSLGASLLVMVSNYSLNKCESKAELKKIINILNKCKKIRDRFLILADLDSQAYLKVVKARGKSEHEKKKASDSTKRVSLKICKLCYEALDYAEHLAVKGNKNLIGDVEAAVEMLQASYNSSMNFIK